MISPEDVPDLLGADARDPSGDKIGTVGQVYHDNATNRPTWVTVNTGLFGATQSVAPLQDARLDGWTVTLAHDKQQIRGAPRIRQDGYLSPKEEIELCRYYGIGGYGRAATSEVYATESAQHRTADRTRDQARDDIGERRARPSGRAPDNAITGSEKRVPVDTVTPDLDRARARMHVVAEQQQPTVPEEEHDGTLHAERPTSATEAVPVERNRGGTAAAAGTEAPGRDIRVDEIVVDTEGRTDRPGDRPR